MISAVFAVGFSLNFTDLLSQLLARHHLTDEQMAFVMREAIGARWAESESAALLVALRMKGETSAEVAAAAGVLREHMVRWQPDFSPVLDTAGTGGDGTRTFNISTATAIVAAGAGTPVVKHGNRSVSSQSGSADVLSELGVSLQADGAAAQRALETAGMAFCFAPNFHPALKNVAAVRRRLGVPTIFNCLGPLANPAGATHQLLGVGREALLNLMAEALHRLGTHNALVVWSEDGLDEVSLSAPTHVRHVTSEGVDATTWTPDDFGLEPCHIEDLRTDGPKQSAEIITKILNGIEGPPHRIVLANTAAALLAAQKVGSLTDGVEAAREAISTGRAAEALEKLRSC